MILIHDRASAAAALTRDLDAPTRAALEAELALLTNDLTDWTDILLIQPGDSGADIEREAGFSPFDDPLSGLRHDHSGFEPGWDHLSTRGGYHRLVFTFGSTHATILLVPKDGSALADLCCRYAAAA
jgi:hypothetical protein